MRGRSTLASYHPALLPSTSGQNYGLSFLTCKGRGHDGIPSHLFLQEKRTVQIKWNYVLLEIIKSIGLYVYVTVMNQSRVLGVPWYSHADGILVHVVIQDAVLL